jgi:hypothetical protein
MLSLTLALVGLATPAHAFCGTYVGGAGAELYNNVAEVAIVRQGNRTTLSMSNDIEGDTSNFAMVIPVPEVLPEDAIHVLDKELFGRLDAYSAPRLVEYECEDFEQHDSGMWANDSAEGGGSDDTGGVEVEAEYVVGEYHIVILSATESSALFSWLGTNGYEVPASSQDLLQEYLDAGSYFFAAQVDESAQIEPGTSLSPLQFAYDADVFGLPIRLGTLNAKETQDLIIYGINGFDAGRMGISNYPEADIEDECLWDSEGETFQQYYAQRFANAYEETDGPAWVTEYAWGGSGCDPCTGTPPNEQDLVSLGYDQTLEEDWRTVYNVFFSRLHMRYAPYEVGQDLTLYHSNLSDQVQQRYIVHERFLEDIFPVCDLGMVSSPGSCDSTDGDGDDASTDDEVRAGCGGNKASALGLGLLGLFGLAGLSRRRRGAATRG